MANWKWELSGSSQGALRELVAVAGILLSYNPIQTSNVLIPVPTFFFIFL
jgi:hypothetical protein